MVDHDVVDCLYCAQLRLQLEDLRLKHLYLHVVEVVLDELEHSVAQGVSLLQDSLYVAFFGGLMLEPDLF